MYLTALILGAYNVKTIAPKKSLYQFGHAIWWYGMPMVMYSFFDEYDFSGKTVIPFCTSGGSAFSDAIDEIKDMEPDAAVLDGLHIGSSGVTEAENSVNEWVSELGLSK